eukprot:GHVL01033679.1.p1 GENE.GHVL01033679.1~~GHVL01033679.1.p1  ORF type:complete len:379 (+),score=64.14 GHVL01033679.1:44-1138(+)
MQLGNYSNYVQHDYQPHDGLYYPQLSNFATFQPDEFRTYQDISINESVHCRDNSDENTYPSPDSHQRNPGWSAEEDQFIIEQQMQVGNRWSVIQKSLKDILGKLRTTHAVKNRFNRLILKGDLENKSQKSSPQRIQKFTQLEKVNSVNHSSVNNSSDNHNSVNNSSDNHNSVNNSSDNHNWVNNSSDNHNWVNHFSVYQPPPSGRNIGSPPPFENPTLLTSLSVSKNNYLNPILTTGSAPPTPYLFGHPRRNTGDSMIENVHPLDFSKLGIPSSYEKPQNEPRKDNCDMLFELFPSIVDSRTRETALLTLSGSNDWSPPSDYQIDESNWIPSFSSLNTAISPTCSMLSPSYSPFSPINAELNYF